MKVKKNEGKTNKEYVSKAKKAIVNVWNKIKKQLKRLWNFIKKIIITLKDKFMELPKKIRMVIYVWCAVIVILFMYIAITNGSNKFYAKYNEMENTISDRALKYVEDRNFYATKDSKLKIDLQTLKEEKYVTSAILTDNTCDGISVVYYDDVKDDYVVDTYLNCKRYTSKNYWDYK